MSSMELEVKILNIDKENIVNKITNAGGKYISSSKQYLCVYDLMYINQRYYADLYELNNEILESRKDIVLAKIKNLFINLIFFCKLPFLPDYLLKMQQYPLPVR